MKISAAAIRHLPYFLAAAEERTFQAAAEALNITQSALSRRVQELERDLDVQLFTRSAKGAQLTDAGRSLVDDARRIIGEFNAAAHRASDLAQGRRVPLRISFTETAIERPVFGTSLRRLRAAYPNVEVTLRWMTSDDQRTTLRSGETDAGFLLRSSDLSEEFESTELSVENMVVALPRGHALAKRKRLVLTDLRGEGLIISARNEARFHHDRVIATCEAGGFMPKIVMEAAHTGAIHAAVAAGIGIAFVIPSSFRHFKNDCYLRPVADFMVPVHLDLVWNRANRSLALLKFVEIVSGA
jgi:DNA-binding transcriptional LysR family regulator